MGSTSRSAGITVPIKKLAEGTAAVAAGRLDYQIDETSRDEVGVLIDSFNRMTRELKNSRGNLNRKEITKRRFCANIGYWRRVYQTVLAELRLSTNQPLILLGIREQDVLGKRYDEAFGFIELDPVRDLFRKLVQGEGRTEEELSLNVRGRL